MTCGAEGNGRQLRNVQRVISSPDSPLNDYYMIHAISTPARTLRPMMRPSWKQPSLSCFPASIFIAVAHRSLEITTSSRPLLDHKNLGEGKEHHRATIAH